MNVSKAASPSTRSAKSSNSGSRSPSLPVALKESLVSRFLIAPLTFITFLLSLSLVDSRNHRLRTHEHSTKYPAPVGFYQHLRFYFHAAIYKPIPGSSPYAHVKSPYVLVDGGTKRDGGSQSAKGQVAEKEQEPWHWHTKQRHLMAAEMEDAFKVRNWVTVLLYVMAGVCVLVGGILWRWMAYWLSA